VFGCNQREQSFNSKIQTLFFELNPYQSLLELVRKILILDFISGFVLPTYLTTLGILAIYGLHRYQLIYLYFKNRNNKPRYKSVLTKFPVVTIQLPIYNEQYVAKRLIEAVARINYPHHLLEIQVLDDSTDETQSITRNCVKNFQKIGFNIQYHHRTNRLGYKAGALSYGLKSAKGEFVAIFDSDFIPNTSFLHDTLHYFTDPTIGMVQVRWGHINQNYNHLTQIEAILLDGHFVMEHGGRNRSGRFFNFNGTAGIWRRKSIETAGGWQLDTLTEDTDLSYRAQLQGWRFIYLPDVVCSAELPVEINSFKSQQFRWTKGLVQNGVKLLPLIVRSNIPLKIKIEAFFHLSANLSYPLMLILSLLFFPAMVFRSYQGWSQVLLIDFPLFVLATVSVSSFYLLSQRELHPTSWGRKIKYLPLLMSIGIGLSVSNTLAVIEALLGIKSPFKRTPKYCIQSPASTYVDHHKHQNKVGFTPFVEIILGIYFCFTTFYIWSSGNYIVIPFSLIFLAGFFYMGLMSLFQIPITRFLQPKNKNIK